MSGNTPVACELPTFEDVCSAADRIRPVVRRTPVFTSRTLDEALDAEVFLKCENFQRAGAFKFRGASHAIATLTPDEVRGGVVTHSSGNHAQALALAARIRGVRATVVIPEGAPAVKLAAAAGYGATVVRCAPTLEARLEATERVMKTYGATLIPPYDHRAVIAGQGTAALELLEQVPDLDLVLAPIGGGGLVAGTALAVKGRSPGTRVVAVEPEAVDDAARGFRAGSIQAPTGKPTLADGLRTSLGRLPFAVIGRLVDDIVTVPEEAIFEATLFLLERTKLVVEPSGAVPLAALRLGRARGRRVGVILSGGNVDWGALSAFAGDRRAW